MSVAFWNQAERFYAFWLVIIAILLAILVIALIFTHSYAKRKNKKKISGGIVFAFVILTLTGLGGYTHYQPYLEQAHYVTPLIRDRKAVFTGYSYYSNYEQSFFRHLQDIEGLRKLTLYQEESTTEAVTYLGENGAFHYFERADGRIFKQSTQVVFSNDYQKTQLTGSRFHLKNADFEKIGFKDPDNTMFIQIEVPAKEEGKHYAAVDELLIPKTEDAFPKWNF